MKNRIEEHMNNLIPMVVEQSNRGERAYDIYSRLLKEEHEKKMSKFSSEKDISKKAKKTVKSPKKLKKIRKK